jgi:hypothetical protein
MGKAARALAVGSQPLLATEYAAISTTEFPDTTPAFMQVQSDEPDRSQVLINAVRRTLFLLVTGTAWAVAFVYVDSESKWGQVVGNIVSEWTQVLGLVLLTKKLIETKSKDSNK